TTKLIRHGFRAGFSHRQSAGCQDVFRPAIELVGIGARSEVELRVAGADKMVVPERQPLGSDGLAGRILHVNATGQGFARVEITNCEMNLCALCRDEAQTIQSRKQQVLTEPEQAIGGNEQFASLAPRGTSGERAGERGDKSTSSLQPSPPSEGGEGEERAETVERN